MFTFRSLSPALLLWGCHRENPTPDSHDGVPATDTSSPDDTGDAEDTGDTGDAVDTPKDDLYPLLPPTPLYTEGRWILDATGARFKLASVNWYGFEELDYVPAGLELAHVDDIAEIVAAMGFNSVRLPFSLEMVEQTTPVASSVVAANPEMEGLTPIEVMDAVIDALAEAGVVVILDNHSSEAVWYSATNGLWYTDAYPESVWISTWEDLAWRYQDHPAVVGFDLRNELRGGATWGGAPETDWKAAANRAADAVHAIDDTKLIVLAGINYGSDFSGVYSDPLSLGVSGRLVYSPHDYMWFHGDIQSYSDLAIDLGNWWGFLLVEDQPYTAPLWVGEFGTCNNEPGCADETGQSGRWFATMIAYLDAGDIDWAYWPLNGTMARGEEGSGREYGAVDWYGVLDGTWGSPAKAELLTLLQSIQEPWAFPE